MSADMVKEGDKVSWEWNGNHPGGTVGEVKAGEVSVTSHRGNEIKKAGDKDDPAVHIERSGNDVVKLASELDVEKKASSDTNGAASEGEKEQATDDKVEKKDEEQNKAEEMAKTEESSKEKDNEAQAGDKRKADEKTEDGKEEEKDAKKQKTTNGAAQSTRGPGRPKANGEKKAATKERKVSAVGKTERKTRSQSKA